MLTLLALACFLASAIWAGRQRAWPLTLLAAGLACWLLASHSIHIDT